MGQQANSAGTGDAMRASEQRDAALAQADRELDLTGEVCPITFVKSKLMLEMMAVGEILRVVVDEGPETDSMPLSLEIEGHEVISVGAVGDGLREIIVRCKQ